MPFKDMREFLGLLKAKGLLARVKVEVDPKWEINGIVLKLFDEAGPAVLFERVKGSDIPLLANLLGTKERLALALETSEDKIRDIWSERSKKTVEPKLVSTGPCKENIIMAEDIDLYKLPIPYWHEKDAGPYIGTLSVAITKDPETGWINAGIYRMMIHSKNETSLAVPPNQHIGVHYFKYERMDKPMPVAIVTGYDPIIEIVGAGKTRVGVNEFALAGGLRGEPVEMVKCETIDLEVPATAEFVFEGEVMPKVRKTDGPFGEYTGYYGERIDIPVFKLKAITYRNNPIYLGTREGWMPSESNVVAIFTAEMDLFEFLKDTVPGIVDVAMRSAYEVIVSIKKMYKGHPQRAMSAVWGHGFGPKHVIVVDDDIDVRSLEQVHWVLCTRVQADRDVLISSRFPGQWLDCSQPPSKRLWQSVMGIDATRPTYEYEEEVRKFPEVCYDAHIKAKVEAQWERYGIKSQ